MSSNFSPRVYHGSRGDQAGLAASPAPRGTACCSEPSASIVKSPKAAPARGLEHEVTAVRRPGRALVVAGPRGEAPRTAAVRAHRPQVVIALPRGVDDRVALGRPARLGVEAALGDAPDVRALRVHHVDLCRAAAIRHEGDLAARGRPRRLGIDPRMRGHPAERTGGHVQDVDLRVAVLRQREGHRSPIRAPRGRAVDAEVAGEELHGAALEREHAVEVRIAAHERRERERARVGAPRRRHVDGLVRGEGGHAHPVVVHELELLHAALRADERDLGVGDAGLARELEHHLVGDAVGEPPGLGRRHRERLGRDGAARAT